MWRAQKEMDLVSGLSFSVSVASFLAAGSERVNDGRQLYVSTSESVSCLQVHVAAPVAALVCSAHVCLRLIMTSAPRRRAFYPTLSDGPPISCEGSSGERGTRGRCKCADRNKDRQTDGQAGSPRVSNSVTAASTSYQLGEWRKYRTPATLLH